MLHARLKHAAAAATLILATVFSVPAFCAEEIDPWPGIRKDVFEARQIEESQALVLDAPYRAEDAGVVPISIKIPAEIAASVKKLTLIIDKNPMPVVAAFMIRGIVPCSS